MRAFEFLDEGVNDNNLYHFTGFTNMFHILKDNCIKKADFRDGISFTRIPYHIFSDRPAVIVFDKNKLSHNFKLEAEYGDIKNMGGIELSKSREAEERIKTDKIENVVKYIKEIVVHDEYVYSGEWDDMLIYLSRVCKRNKIKFLTTYGLGFKNGWQFSTVPVLQLIKERNQSKRIRNKN